MRISTSDLYYHGYGSCDILACGRHYCPEHRLLWRDCDTAKKGFDDTYSNGRPHFVWEMGDCPFCEENERRKRAERARQAFDEGMRKQDEDAQ